MKAKTTIQIIAVEGWPWVLALGLSVVFLMLLGALKLALFVLVIAVMVGFYFRNNERIALESDALSLTAPIDGRVESVTLHSEGVALALSNGLLDNHLIRSPLSGALLQAHQRRAGICGIGREALAPLAHQEQLTLTSSGPVAGVKLILEPQLSPPGLYVQSGDTLMIGQRIGFLPAGRVTLWLPKNIELRVAIGDRVVGGESPIGFLRSGQ